MAHRGPGGKWRLWGAEPGPAAPASHKLPDHFLGFLWLPVLVRAMGALGQKIGAFGVTWETP